MKEVLSPNEQRLIDYHRFNLARGGMRHPGGDVTTFYGGLHGVGDTEEGRTIYAPGYFNGKINSGQNDILNHAKKTGLYAEYPTLSLAKQREAILHAIMEKDLNSVSFPKYRQPLSYLLGMK
jgi:hypothetical protein